ncbi:MAG: transglycosylase SLT domain-containing protein [Ktedonobacteraceae bacterium]|nr:transglycosylase SLT domain-containing protein [Ktedonobacteraceae bacterium]
MPFPSKQEITSVLSAHNLLFHKTHRLVLIAFTICLLLGSVAVTAVLQAAHASNTSTSCSWYTIHGGDSLSGIAAHYHTSVSALAQANHIRNVNMIYAGQRLCIPQHSSGNGGGHHSGIQSDGTVRWYAYDALASATRGQVEATLRQTAAEYHLPANLVLAIAWQESGWTQHVIARDGGIGVMQLMPGTAMDLNRSAGMRRDPYQLSDNIHLGASYLRMLWNGFHGNLDKVVSAYNEGGYAVQHRGIFNWSYVHSVESLMRQYR